MKIRPILAACALALSATTVFAHEFKQGAITIGHPYARPTIAGQVSGGGYLSLDNKGAAGDRLVSASSEAAQKVELHSMSMDGDVMRMRQVDAIDLPAGQRVELKPGGLHIMLLGLKAPLKQGESFALKLRFEKAGEATVRMNVDAPAAPAAPAAAASQAEPAHKH